MFSQGSTKTKLTPKTFLKGYPPNIRAIAEQLRVLVRQAVPDAYEEVKLGWRLIGYRVSAGKGSAYICFIAPSQNAVELGFEYGALLDDPHQIINKKLKQVHSIVVRSPDEINAQHMTELIHQAAMIAIEKKEMKSR